MNAEEQEKAKQYYLDSDIEAVHITASNTVEINYLDMLKLMHGCAVEYAQSKPVSDEVKHVGSYNLTVGDAIKMPSGLRAKVIKTKVKVKDEFGGEYYLSDIEVG